MRAPRAARWIRGLAGGLAVGLAGLPAVAGARPAPFCVTAPRLEAAPRLAGLVPVGQPEAPAKGIWTWYSLWASWCAPCLEELPRLRAWQARLGGPERLRLVLLNVDAEPAAAEAVRARLGLPGSWHVPEALRAGLVRSLGLFEGSLPVQVLADPSGRVVCAHEGAVEAAHWPAVEARLAGGSPSAPSAGPPRP